MTLVYQLYSAHEHQGAPDLLPQLAQSGMTAVEGYGPWLDDPDRTRSALDAVGLAMPSAHIALQKIEQDPVGVVACARSLGLRHVYIPYLAPEERPQDAQGWRDLARRVMRATSPLKAAGLTCGWHNHDFELVPLADGTMPLTVMADEAPDLMFELDLGWIARVGQSPVAWLQELRGRVRAVHLKDLTATDWADPGQGDQDWPAILAELDAHKNVLRVVERDDAPDPISLAKAAVTHFAQSKATA